MRNHKTGIRLSQNGVTYHLQADLHAGVFAVVRLSVERSYVRAEGTKYHTSNPGIVACTQNIRCLNKTKFANVCKAEGSFAEKPPVCRLDGWCSSPDVLECEGPIARVSLAINPKGLCVPSPG